MRKTFSWYLRRRILLVFNIVLFSGTLVQSRADEPIGRAIQEHEAWIRSSLSEKQLKCVHKNFGRTDILEEIQKWKVEHDVLLSPSTSDAIQIDYLVGECGFSTEDDNQNKLVRSKAHLALQKYLSQLQQGTQVTEFSIVLGDLLGHSTLGFPAKNRFGVLQVLSNRPQVSISIDSTIFDEGSDKFLVSVGEHQVTVRSVGDPECSRMAKVKAGATEKVQCNF